MQSDKTIHLSMTEIKELNFRLDAARQALHEQKERSEDVSEQTMLREKAEFLDQIIEKLNH